MICLQPAPKEDEAQTVEKPPTEMEELLSSMGRLCRQEGRQQAMEEFKRRASSAEKEAVSPQEELLEELRQAEDELATRNRFIRQLDAEGKTEIDEMLAALRRLEEAEQALELARYKAGGETEKQISYLKAEHAKCKKQKEEHESALVEKDVIIKLLRQHVEASGNALAMSTLQEQIEQEEKEKKILMSVDVGSLKEKLEEMKSKWELQARVLTSINNDVKQFKGMVSSVLRAVTFLAQGETECPQLFIFTPREATRSFNEQSWFSHKWEVTFLCASNLEPVVERSVLILEPHEFVRKAGPAIKVSMQAIKMILAVGLIADLGTFASFLCSRFGLDVASGLFEKVEEGVNKMVRAATHDDKSNSLDIFNGIVQMAEKKDLEDSQLVQLQKAWRMSGSAFMVVAQLARPILGKLPMKKMVAADGTVAWVHEKHAQEWAQAGRACVEVSINQGRLQELEAEERVQDLEAQISFFNSFNSILATEAECLQGELKEIREAAGTDQ